MKRFNSTKLVLFLLFVAGLAVYAFEWIGAKVKLVWPWIGIAIFVAMIIGLIALLGTLVTLLAAICYYDCGVFL